MIARTGEKHPALLLFMTVHCAASLLHFAHNAIYLRDYPNLPASLTAAGVYAAWVGITAVGIVGYLVYRRRSETTGLSLIAIYATLGFGGLDHYVVASIAAHSVMMNTTILVEVVSAAALLAFALTIFMKRSRRERSVGGI